MTCQGGALFDPDLQVCIKTSQSNCATASPTLFLVTPSTAPPTITTTTLIVLDDREPAVAESLFDVDASAAGLDDAIVDTTSSFIGGIYEDNDSSIAATSMSHRPVEDVNGTHIGTHSVPDNKSDGKPREKLDEEGELRVLASEGLTPFLVSSLNVQLPVSLRASTWFVWSDCSSNGSSWSSGCHKRQEEGQCRSRDEGC